MLRVPLKASVTVWEATAPVKLPCAIVEDVEKTCDGDLPGRVTTPRHALKKVSTGRKIGRCYLRKYAFRIPIRDGHPFPSL